MSIDLVTTGYGPAAFHALAATVRGAKAGEPLAPVTVVVPSNHVGVTARRLLAGGLAGSVTPNGVGTVAVTFLTPYRLAELLGAPALAADGRRPVSIPVLTAAFRTVLRADAGLFAPVADHPATEEALVTTYADLTDVSAGALDALTRAGPRAADVVRVYRAARARLTDRWYDEADLARAARTALADPSGGDRARDIGHLVIYLPQDLTRQTARLLAAVAERRPTTVIAGTTGHPAADRGVLRSLSRLGLTPDPPEPSLRPAASPTRIVTLSDAEEESRFAVQAVVDAARRGTPLERMAVLFPTREPYARALAEQFGAAGIPVNGTAVRPLAERTYGRALLHLPALGDRDYRRQEVLGLLTALPVRTPAGAPAPTADWERLSREAGVTGGRDQWDRRLTELADRFDRRADGSGPAVAAATPEDPDSAAGPDGNRRRLDADRLRRRAGRVRALRRIVLDLIDDLERAARAPESWHARVRSLRRISGRLLGGEAGRDDWPEEERRAAERVDTALERLAALDEIDSPCTLEVFRRTLELELHADLGRTGRFGEGVLVAPLSFGVGLHLDLVVVVGAAEGLLPARLLEDSLLPDHERRHAGDELPLRRHHADRQRRHLDAALAAADHRILTAPRGDLRMAGDRSLSRWLDELEAALDAVHREDVPSFAYRVRHNPTPATAQEYRLHPGVSVDDAVSAAGRELLTARRSSDFTRFDGNVAHVRFRTPLTETGSPTRLEMWAECPHAYFVRHLLGVRPVDDPAEQMWITAPDKGSLIHEVLERFLREVLARPPHDRPAPDDPWRPADRAALRRIAEQVCDRYEERGMVGRTLFWRRDRSRILATLDRFLTDDGQQRATGRSRPVAAELAFGLPGADLGAVDLPLPDGRRLRFRGTADRVDIDDDGTLRVIDYKTGRADPYRGLSTENPDDGGTHLQLAVYGVAAGHHAPSLDHRAARGGPVRAEYWFISDRAKLKTIGYPVTADVIERVGANVATIVDGIAAGVFPARPTETASDPFVPCHYCNPDGIGVSDRRREWEQKRRHPALAAYARLAEPLDPDDPEEAAR